MRREKFVPLPKKMSVHVQRSMPSAGREMRNAVHEGFFTERAYSVCLVQFLPAYHTIEMFFTREKRGNRLVKMPAEHGRGYMSRRGHSEPVKVRTRIAGIQRKGREVLQSHAVPCQCT